MKDTYRKTKNKIEQTHGTRLDEGSRQCDLIHRKGWFALIRKTELGWCPFLQERVGKTGRQTTRMVTTVSSYPHSDTQPPPLNHRFFDLAEDYRLQAHPTTMDWTVKRTEGKGDSMMSFRLGQMQWDQLERI